MGFNCGIVGLPNVGKSTLFNALTQTAAAEAANYPFCTIEPNTGRVAVPDIRLSALAELANSKTVIPTISNLLILLALFAAHPKAKGLAISFLAISAKSMRLRMYCAVLKMAKSRMLMVMLIRFAMLPLLKPN